jgi:DNA-3-methyladenine glycosylase
MMICSDIHQNHDRLTKEFYQQEVLTIAPLLLGKPLVRRLDDGTQLRLTINEVEAYRGEEDLACHARFGRTARNSVMYQQGGVVYMYFIYGMYWMLNVVTGSHNFPEAILIRGAGEYNGPGKLTKALVLDKSFYGEDLATSERLWIEDAPTVECYKTTPRIGIGYAAKEWRDIHWRFTL